MNTEHHGLVQFNHSNVSDSLQPHGLEHARLSCPSPAPRASSDSRPLSWWCHPTISSSVVPFSSCLQSFPESGSFLMSAFHIRWPKYWSFSVSIIPSKEYPGLMDVAKSWLVYGVAKSWTRLSDWTELNWTMLFCFCFFVVVFFFGKKENLHYMLIWFEFTFFGKNTLYCMLYSNRSHKIFCHPTLSYYSLGGLKISESDGQINELSRYTLF